MTRRAAIVVTVAVVAFAVVGLMVVRANRPSSTDVLAPPPTAAPGALRAVPAFKHVFVVVFENKGYPQIVGSPDAPYFNQLIAKYGLATNYRGLFHPSQPNYIALVSGSSHGVTDDNVHDVTGPTLFDQIEASGRDWRVVEENYPGSCFTGKDANDGPDGSGQYVRKHNPAISFTGVQTSADRCAKIVPLKQFQPGAADFQLVVPNLCNDMHDCSVAAGDKWLAGWLPQLLSSPAYLDGGAIFVTFDEPASSARDDRSPTIVIAPGMPPGFQSSEPETHYTLLRTIQQAWGLPCLANSCQAGTMGEFFATGK